MQMFKRKSLINFLIVLIVVALCMPVAACGRGSGDGDGEEEVIVRDYLESCQLKILLCVDKIPSDAAAVVSAINAKLLADGKPYSVFFDYVLNHNYVNTIDSKVRAGYDGGYASPDDFQDFITTGKIKTNLSPYLKEYGQDILENMEAYKFDSVRNWETGSIFAIPANIPTANGTDIQLIRQDWLEQVGMSEITSLAEYDDYLSKISNEKGIGRNNDGTVKSGFYAHVPDSYNSFLTREFCPDYFFPIVKESSRPLYIDISESECTVKSFYQSQAFIDTVRHARSYADAGYVNIAYSSAGENMFFQQLSGSISDYSVTKLQERAEKFVASVPEGKLADVLLGSDNKIVFTTALNTMVAFKNSTHTEEYIDFINWFRSKQENMDLMNYGILGRNYYLTDEGRFTYTDPANKSNIIPANMRFADYMPGWAYWDVNFIRWSEVVSDEYIQSVMNWEGSENGVRNFKISPLCGFRIQPTVEYLSALAKVNETTPTVNLLMRGFRAYNETVSGSTTYLQSVINAINNDSAIDNLIKEVQRQLNTFITKKAATKARLDAAGGKVL